MKGLAIVPGQHELHKGYIYFKSSMTECVLVY